MKISAIKKAFENYTIGQLKQAEDDLYNDKIPEIELGGDDEGENLTHALATIWIMEDMEKNGTVFNDSLRKYTQRVRTSIS